MATKKGRDIGGDVDGNIIASPDHYMHLRDCEQVLRNLLHELKHTPEIVKTDVWRCEFVERLETFLKNGV